jgi:L-malate glycosyltransferase
MTKMKKILYVGNKLSNKNTNVTTIETLGKLLTIEGYQLYYSSSKKNKAIRLLDMMYATIKYAKTVDYVIIDVYSTLNFWYAIIISQLCRILNLKYIARLHGGNLPSRLIKNPFLSNLIFKNAYKIVAPSGYLMDAFSKNYSENLIYIPNTIEINKYAFFNRNIIDPKLLWVRSFSKIYNPKMAIKVLSELKKEFPNPQLCMVGPDVDNGMEQCKLLAKELNVEVFFTGKLTREEWISLSKEYTIFINTTHFDNTPVSVIEAMALGLPVVSTNVGGIPFLLKNNENALLVDDDDTNAMVNAIKRLCNSAELKDAIVIKARAKVADFDWEIVKSKWIEIVN